MGNLLKAKARENHLEVYFDNNKNSWFPYFYTNLDKPILKIKSASFRIFKANGLNGSKIDLEEWNLNYGEIKKISLEFIGRGKEELSGITRKVYFLKAELTLYNKEKYTFLIDDIMATLNFIEKAEETKFELEDLERLKKLFLNKTRDEIYYYFDKVTKNI